LQTHIYLYTAYTLVMNNLTPIYPKYHSTELGHFIDPKVIPGELNSRPYSYSVHTLGDVQFISTV